MGTCELRNRFRLERAAPDLRIANNINTVGPLSVLFGLFCGLLSAVDMVVQKYDTPHSLPHSFPKPRTNEPSL